LLRKLRLGKPQRSEGCRAETRRAKVGLYPGTPTAASASPKPIQISNSPTAIIASQRIARMRAR